MKVAENNILKRHLMITIYEQTVASWLFFFWYRQPVFKPVLNALGGKMLLVTSVILVYLYSNFFEMDFLIYLFNV